MPIYDVENRFSYYKSYSDNTLVGSPKPTMGSTTWDRTALGSVVSGSEEWEVATLVTDFTYQRSNPFFRSGEVRYLRLASANQSIQDSYTPDIVGIYMTGSWGAGKLTTYADSLDSGQPEILLLFATSSVVVITGSDHVTVSNSEWRGSQPFEKKYSFVPTDRQQPKYRLDVGYEIARSGEYNLFQARVGNTEETVRTNSFVIGDASLDVAAPYTKSLNLYADSPGTYDPGYSSPLLPDDWHPSPVSLGVGTFVNLLQCRKLVFGIKPQPVYKFHTNTFGLDECYTFSTSLGITCEGWKYGLYNGIPTKFSCVFRQNHYGQFRDMLEQRIYTQTYNDSNIGGPLDNNGGISFISGSALPGESDNYLTASIYGGSNVAAAYAVNPYGSGMFDKLYRASQPWHDDDPRVGT